MIPLELLDFRVRERLVPDGASRRDPLVLAGSRAASSRSTACTCPKRLARVGAAGAFPHRDRSCLRRGDTRLRRRRRDPEDPGTWINEEIIESYTRAARARLRALGRGLARRPAGRRALRRRAARRVLRRVDVPPRDRRLEGGARRAGRAAARRAATRCSTPSGRRRTSSSSAPSRFRATEYLRRLERGAGARL